VPFPPAAHQYETTDQFLEDMVAHANIGKERRAAWLQHATSG
jgi:hypothetical protein